MRMKITQEVSDFIINRDEQVTESKDIPVSHFLIDLRPAVIQQVLDDFQVAVFGHETQNLYQLCANKQALSIYELSALFEQINAKWGSEIENQKEIMYCIDALFDKLSPIVKIEFYFYLFCFLVPFVA